MRRSYKFRLRTTAKQHVAFGQCLDAHRELYNAALQERRDAYKWVVKESPSYWSGSRPKAPVNYGRQSAQLIDIRASRPDIACWSFSSQQTTLRRLNKAFGEFFRRVASGATPGYPRFKAAHRFDSVEWPKDGDGCRWKPETSRVYFQGIGDVKVTAHRKVQGRLKTISVKREGRRWFLVLSCDDVVTRPLPPTGEAVGIDVGIANFAALSTGELDENPRYARKAAGRLAAAQRVLGAKKRGSKNRDAARATVAALHRKIANCRRDFHHKTARTLVEHYDVLCVEALKVKNMARSAKGTLENPGTNVATKSGLNRSIQDVGWAQFVSILKGKAEEAGRDVIDVNPRHTSQMCAECGHVDPGNRVSQAVFRCQNCGHEAHADVNAARNILRAGLALQDVQAA